MEKLQQEKQNKFSHTKWCSTCTTSTALWDCGSTLYDSFELNSFKRQINSAIANSPRSLSMPHLPDRRFPLIQLQQPPKKPFNISRSFQKLLRSVFKASNNKSGVSGTSNNKSKERFYVAFDKSGSVLSAIPEVSEFEIGAISPPRISSLAGRSASERFLATTSIGISCA